MSVLSSILKLSIMDGITPKVGAISGAINGLTRQSRQVMAPINSTMMRVTGLAAGYIGVREGLRGTVGASIGFESAFADVRKVVDGTDNQLNTLRRDIIKLSKEMPVSAEGFAQIYAAAGQSNIPIREMSKFSKMVAEVSTAWEVPVAETGQALAEIKNQLRMNVEDIGLYADAINHLGNNTAARAPDLVDYSKRVAATGELYGFAAAETLAFGGAMIASGAQSEVAATSFRNMGRALTIGERATKKHTVAYGKLGLDSVKVAKSMQKNAVKTTLDVIDRIQKLPEWQRISIASALFGEEARALMPLINNSTDLRRQLEMVGDKANYAGSSFEEYRIRAETTANTIDKVKNNFTALGIGIGDSFLPTINSGLTGVLDVFATLEKRTGFFEEFSIGAKGFMQGLGFKDARELVNGLADLVLGPVLDPKGMSDAGERLGRIFMNAKEWGASIRELSAAISESPITQFFAEMAGYGFKFVLLAAGIGMLSKGIFGLGKALLYLSGAKLGLDILKGIVKVGGPLLIGTAAGGAAAGAAGTGAAGAGAAGAVTAAATKGGVFSKLLRGAGATALAAGLLEVLDFTDSKGNLWGLTENIDNWSKKNFGINPSNIAEQDEKGVPGWKRLLMGRAADPDFSFREHMGIKTKAGSANGDQQVSLTAPTIADLNKPAGTQDVRVVNQQPPPHITNYVSITATTNATPAEIGAQAAEAVGQASKAAIESAFSDAAVSQ